MNDLPLAAEFPAVRREDWLALVEKVLKGKSFDRLRAKTRDGIAIEPLYDRAAKAAPLAGRAPGAPWQIAQRVDHPDPAAANAEALHELENGAGALSLVFAGSIGAYGYGLDGSAAAIDRALADVHLDAGIALELDLSPQTKDAGAHLAALVKKRGITPGKTDIRFGFDPLGAMAAGGGSPLAWKELAPVFHSAIDAIASQGFDGPFAVADGRVVHNAGGSEAQELAFVLAAAITYVRALETSGVPFQDFAAYDFLSALCRRRSVSHDRKIPCAAETLGSRRGSIRPGAEVDLHLGRNGVAHADEARPVREHVARDNCRRGGWFWRRQCDQRAPVYVGGRFTGQARPPDRPQHAADPARGVASRKSNRSGRRAPARSRRSRRACAIRHGICFRRSSERAVRRPHLSRDRSRSASPRCATERANAIADRREPITGTTMFPNQDELPVSVLKTKPVTVPPLPKTVVFEPLTAMRLSEPYE